MADFIETTSPYIACAVVFFALGAGVILYLDRGYKQRIQCATCRKKMFSIRQDVPSSDAVTPPAELDQRRAEFARYLVAHGYVSDHK